MKTSYLFGRLLFMTQNCFFFNRNFLSLWSRFVRRPVESFRFLTEFRTCSSTKTKSEKRKVFSAATDLPISGNRRSHLTTPALSSFFYFFAKVNENKLWWTIVRLLLGKTGYLMTVSNVLIWDNYRSINKFTVDIFYTGRNEGIES